MNNIMTKTGKDIGNVAGRAGRFGITSKKNQRILLGKRQKKNENFIKDNQKMQIRDREVNILVSLKFLSLFLLK